MFTLWYLVLGYKEYNRGCRNTTPSQLSNNEKISNEPSNEVKPEPVKKPVMKYQVPETRPTEPVKIPERPKMPDPKTTEPVRVSEVPKEPDSKPTEPVKMPERPKMPDPKTTEPVRVSEVPEEPDSKPTEPVKMPERPKMPDPKTTEPVRVSEVPEEPDSKPTEPMKMTERPKMPPDSNSKFPWAVKPDPGFKAPIPERKDFEALRPEDRRTAISPERKTSESSRTGPADKVNPPDSPVGQKAELEEFELNKYGKEESMEAISRDDKMLGRKPAGINGAEPRQDMTDPKALSYPSGRKNKFGRVKKSNSKKDED